MVQFPMTFTAQAHATAGIQQPWTAQVSTVADPLPVSIPPEFSGPGAGYSPEDLYLLALENCFVATFKVFAEKSKINYEQLIVDADLIVDRNPEGHPWMAKVHLKVRLAGCDKKEQAERLLERVSTNCLILNSVKTEKVFEFHVS